VFGSFAERPARRDQRRAPATLSLASEVRLFYGTTLVNGTSKVPLVTVNADDPPLWVKQVPVPEKLPLARFALMDAMLIVPLVN
jgi:hypothetical protein